ncbi:MAG TPA: hypothetical protein VNN22_13520 [Verrucomicrobiae bacterium]|nr:hypothetical protein [Verrucomicrobiae bacterium]
MKTKHQQNLLATALIGALASVITTARADDTGTTPASIPTAAEVASPTMAPTDTMDEEPWQFGVIVPLWAPQINGNATIRGVQRDVDISFDQLKDHLDASFALGLQAQKGKFGIFGDVGYMKFSGDVKARTGAKANFGLEFVLADAGISYVLVKTISDCPFTLQGTLGLRYWYTRTTLLIKDSGGNVLLNGSNYQNLEDPVIGLRASQYFTKKFHLDLAGDIGGFGMSDSQATLDWSATGMATYDFVKWFSLSAGYKAVGLDASKGSGEHKNGVNVIFNGALIAATFKF